MIAEVSLAGEVRGEEMNCEWKEDWEGTWETGCKNKWVFNEGTPEDNHMKFCTFCGKPLKQIVYVEDET